MSRGQGFAIGARVRVTAGDAKGIEGVIIAEWVPLKPKQVREWTLRTDDIVGRREIREDYLEVVSP